MLSVVLLLAMDERNRRKFAVKSDVCTADGKYRFLSREDAVGMSQRFDTSLAELGRSVDRNSHLFVSLDDRIGTLEGQTARIEERQTQQWERISAQMASTAETIKQVTSELKDISRMQQDFALQMERMRYPKTAD